LLTRFSIGVFNEGGGLLFRFHFYEQPGNHRIKDISFISLNNFNLITEFLLYLIPTLSTRFDQSTLTSGTWQS
jgi:hypothetical protein